MVLGPVLLPPWQRHRPLIMAGARHGSPARLRAPQRGAAFGLPRGLPCHLTNSIINGLWSTTRNGRTPAAKVGRTNKPLPTSARSSGGCENDLLPRCGDIPITAISEHDLNEWVREFRVEDREATVAKYGRQQRSETRQVVYKAPRIDLGQHRLGVRLVWDEAVPIVSWIGAIARSSTKLGADGEAGAFIDDAGVLAVHAGDDR